LLSNWWLIQPIDSGHTHIRKKINHFWGKSAGEMTR